MEVDPYPDISTFSGYRFQGLCVTHKHQIAVIRRAAKPCPLLNLTFAYAEAELAVTMPAQHLPLVYFEEGIKVGSVLSKDKTQMRSARRFVWEIENLPIVGAKAKHLNLGVRHFVLVVAPTPSACLRLALRHNSRALSRCICWRLRRNVSLTHSAAHLPCNRKHDKKHKEPAKNAGLFRLFGAA